MRPTTPAAVLVLVTALSGCTGSDAPAAASPAPDLCPAGAPAEECLDRLQLELSEALERSADGRPVDQDHLEQAFTEVVRAERIGRGHSFTRVTDPQDRDVDAPAPTTPVEFRLGVGDVQRSYWACLPSSILVTPGPCPPATGPA